jgi:hypothetical protein
MSFQLSIPGFPEPRKKAVYSGPSPVKSTASYHNPFVPLPSYLSIGPTHFTLFTNYSSIRGRKRAMAGLPPIQVKRILDTGTMSRGARSCFMRAMSYLALIAKEKTVFNSEKNYHFKFRQSFITLTLPSKQMHSDNYVKQNILNQFIDALQKRYPSLSYVWRAEKQGNGNIHFHLLTDHFIPRHHINYRWRKVLWHHGYMQKFYDKHPTKEAPAAEIRKVRNDAELSMYMRKYLIKGLSRLTVPEIHAKIDSCKNRLLSATGYDAVTKLNQQIKSLYNMLAEVKKPKIKGKLWGCSGNLLLKPKLELVEGLSLTSYNHAFEQEILCEKEWFTCFKIASFKRFIQGFSRYDYELIRDYFKALVQPIPIPVMIYDTAKNYSYRAA